MTTYPCTGQKLTARADGTQPPAAGRRYQLSTLLLPARPLAGFPADAPRLVAPARCSVLGR